MEQILNGNFLITMLSADGTQIPLSAHDTFWEAIAHIRDNFSIFQNSLSSKHIGDNAEDSFMQMVAKEMLDLEIEQVNAKQLRFFLTVSGARLGEQGYILSNLTIEG